MTAFKTILFVIVWAVFWSSISIINSYLYP